jgi:hypothetical protein
VAKQREKKPVIVFKTTYLSERGIRTLGEHALSLPHGHPARATIRNLIQRWIDDGKLVTFPAEGGPDTELTFEDYAALMTGEDDELADAVVPEAA